MTSTESPENPISLLAASNSLLSSSRATANVFRLTPLRNLVNNKNANAFVDITEVDCAQSKKYFYEFENTLNKFVFTINDVL